MPGPTSTVPYLGCCGETQATGVLGIFASNGTCRNFGFIENNSQGIPEYWFATAPLRYNWNGTSYVLVSPPNTPLNLEAGNYSVYINSWDGINLESNEYILEFWLQNQGEGELCGPLFGPYQNAERLELLLAVDLGENAGSDLDGGTLTIPTDGEYGLHIRVRSTTASTHRFDGWVLLDGSPPFNPI